jgi:endonuclease/exonuclease/phosphatase family metal-dependent hydrolase
VQGRRAAVVSVHLGLSAAERLEQARVLRPALAQWSDGPWVVAGDLNEQPGAPAFQVLAEGFQDAGAVLGKPTFPARGPTRRIDAVLVDPRLRVASCRTLTGLARATDHCPVIVDLEPA